MSVSAAMPKNTRNAMHPRSKCGVCQCRRLPAKASDARRMQPDGPDDDPFDCDWNCQHCYLDFAWELPSADDYQTPPLTYRLGS